MRRSSPGSRRIRLISVSALALASFLTCSVPVLAQEAAPTPTQEELSPANALSAAFGKVADIITPSVVSISAVKRVKAPKGRRPVPRDPFFDQFRDFFGDDLFDRFGPHGMPDFSQQGLGTGVIIDPEGYILTNNHVVGEADEVMVHTHDSQKFKAEVVGSDPRTDLAVIKIKSSGLTVAKLGDSDALQIGEWVIASGNPFGLEKSITAGIVSAKGRSISGGGQYEDFIQTDAAINPGNSGGPLVNLKGEVVGINTAIFSKSGGYMGIGFAIPINMAKSVMQSLISRGRVIRGWLGIGIQNLTEDLARSFNVPSTEGALVGHVESGGPAERAGLQQGDIIVEIDGDKMKDMNELRNKVASITPATTAPIVLIRNGRKMTIDVKIGELPAQESEQAAQEEESKASEIGLALDSLTPELARRLGSRRTKGVVVTAVKPGSIAQAAGIQSGDVIVSVNGKSVEDITSFGAMISKEDLEKGIRFVVESRGMERFIFLRSSE